MLHNTPYKYLLCGLLLAACTGGCIRRAQTFPGPRNGRISGTRRSSVTFGEEPAASFKSNVPATPCSSDVIVGAGQTERYLPLLAGRNVGLLTSHTGLVGHTHLVDTLLARGVAIRRIFAPEHGFRGEADAGERRHELPGPKDRNRSRLALRCQQAAETGTIKRD
ncbi:MAG: exo-beta-N-acetylmuramidase NamZ domain-containing protein [Alistipes indistinctus]